MLQAGLWAITGKSFAIETTSVPPAKSAQFRSALVKRAIREKMIPMLAVYSRAHDQGLACLAEQLSKVFGFISREHYSHLKPILDTLAHHEIPVVLIKGADLDLATYSQAFPRAMGDIDILIRPVDAPAVVDVFKRQGFIQGKLDRVLRKLIPLSDSERMEFEEDNIELAEFSKLVAVPELFSLSDVIEEHLPHWWMVPAESSYHLALGYDVHLHLSLEFDPEDVWTNLRTLDFPEVGRCLAQSFTDAAWYLAIRFYHDLHLISAPIMRSFLDVFAILLRHQGSIDWDRIVYVATKYKLHPSLYYVFWHVAEIRDGLVPERVLKSLFPPAADDDRGHDWGDFVPKMLGEVQLLPLLTR